jgi:hypothetical protein
VRRDIRLLIAIWEADCFIDIFVVYIHTHTHTYIYFTVHYDAREDRPTP